MWILLTLTAALLAPSRPAEGPTVDRNGVALPRGAVARSGSWLLRHRAPPVGLAVDAKGGWLVSIGNEGLARGWGAKGKLLWEKPVAGATHTMVGSVDNTVWWHDTDGLINLDVATGKRLRLIKCGGGAPIAVAVSADGQTVAGLTNHSLFVFNAAGTPLTTLKVEQQHELIALSPSGRHVAYGHSGGLAAVAEVKTGKVLWSKTVCTQDSDGLAFDSEDRVLVPCRDKTIKRFSTATGEPLPPIPLEEEAYALAIEPANGTIAVGALSGEIAIYPPNTVKPARRFATHASEILTLAWGAGGEFLASGGADQTVRVWHAPTGTERTPRVEYSGPHYGVAIAPDDKSFVTVGTQVSRWSLKDGAFIEHLMTLRQATDMGFSPMSVAFWAGGVLVGAQDSPPIAITGKTLSRLPEGVDGAMAFTRHRDRLFGLCGSASHICAWHGKAQTPTRHSNADASFLQLAAGAGLIVASTESGSVLVWHKASLEGAPQKVHAFGSGIVVHLGADPGGRFFATAVESKLTIWSPDGVQLAQRPLKRHPRSLEFSPDGTRLAVGTRNGRLSLYDVSNPKSPQPLREVLAHDGSIEDLAFTSDGKRLVSVSDDLTALIWTVP